MKKKFKCEIDCADCAAKLENALKKIEGVEDVSVNFIMQKLTLTADESVMENGKPNMDKVNAIAFDPYTHGYYKVSGRVGEAFKDGLKLK